MSSITSYPNDENRQAAVSAETLPYSNSPNRILSLDVLRGVAVLGAMFTSIWIFGGFSDNQQTGLITQSKGLNYRLFSIVDLLFFGKMRALIAIVFGAGMLLYLFKESKSRQLHNADFFIRRQMWLIAFGLINALVFLSSGDLLFHLGIMGVLLFPFIRLSARGLLIAAIITMLIYCGKTYWRYADDNKVYNKYLAVVAAKKKITKDSVDKAKKAVVINNIAKDSIANKQKKDTLTKKQTGEKQAWEGLVKGMKYDSAKDDTYNKTMHETSYGKIWNNQLSGTQWREAQWTYTTGIWEIGSMIFLGMALFRFGFFDHRFSSAKYGLLALAGTTLGALCGWYRLHYQQLAILDYENYISHNPLPYHFFFPLEIFFMAFGYASLVLLLVRLRFLKQLQRVLSVAGQMALTNYLMQSIICVFFFTGFGMGYFARLQQWQLYVFAAEVILTNIAFSMLWLRYYNYGPAEWLLRCLIYKKWLPNKKDKLGTQPVIAVS